MLTLRRHGRNIFSFLGFLITVLAIPPSFAQHRDSAYAEGRPYRNLFGERGLTTSGHAASQLKANWNLARLNATYQLIYDVSNSNPAEAYVLDVNSNDIRSEGMSYGMFVAVLLDDKVTFDKLWRFALNRTRQSQGWFAWQTSATSPYSPIDRNPAPDGEEYMAMALFLAHGRWGSATGSQNYIQYANDILNVLRTQLFDPQSQLIYFSPATSTKYTDPSYHLPLFYELWALWANSNNDFWRSAAVASRAFLKKAAHPTTGLFPEYAHFDGRPTDPNTNGNANSGRFAYDSWRVIQNIAVDYYWWSRDPELKAIVERQQRFYESTNFDYRNIYELNGMEVGTDQSRGHVWMNAVSALVSPIYGGYSGAPGNNDIGWDLLQQAYENYWTMPTGQYRYYDGMLQLLGMVFTTGQFNLYGPTVSGSSSDLFSNLSYMVQPSLRIRNTTADPLANFAAKYFFTLEGGNTPVVEAISTPNANLTLEHIRGSLWAVNMDFSGARLEKKEQFSSPERFTLRYIDLNGFDKSNDYSQPESATQNSTSHVAVFNDRGDLLMGSMPPGERADELHWVSLDTPNSTGDYETLSALKEKKPKLYCDKPIRVDARIAGTDYIYSTDTGFPDKFQRFDAKSGLVCRDEDQEDGKCNAYKVRYLCDGSWTIWLDPKKSSAIGYCSNRPTQIQASTTIAGVTVLAYGPPDRLSRFSTQHGLACKHSDQPDGKKCKDYSVSFVCP